MLIGLAIIIIVVEILCLCNVIDFTPIIYFLLLVGYIALYTILVLQSENFKCWLCKVCKDEVVQHLK